MRGNEASHVFGLSAKDLPVLLFGHYVMGYKVRKPTIILFL